MRPILDRCGTAVGGLGVVVAALAVVGLAAPAAPAPATGRGAAEVVLTSPHERISFQPLPALPPTAAGYLAGPSAVSADGRLVAFDFGFQDFTVTPEKEDVQVYVRDRATDEVEVVSADAGGVVARRSSRLLDLSADGRFALFTSRARNLVADDANRRRDVFHKDLLTGAVRLVSVSSAGVPGNRGSGIFAAGALSADGRLAAFLSNAGNLVARDTNRSTDAFVHDVRTGRTSRVNVTSGERQSHGAVYGVDLSGDGRLVTFDGTAADLVAADSDRASDVFLRNRERGTTRLLSRRWDDFRVLPDAFGGTISSSGRFVAFSATNRGRSPCSTAYVVDRRRGTARQAGAAGCAPSFWSTTVDAMSARGRWLLVTSDAPLTAEERLAPGDVDPDAFLVDRRDGTVTRVSAVAPGGQEPGGYAESLAGDLSADGRLATFASAVDFLPETVPEAESVYARDLSEAVAR
jgi:hypothetical protein